MAAKALKFIKMQDGVSRKYWKEYSISLGIVEGWKLVVMAGGFSERRMQDKLEELATEEDVHVYLGDERKDLTVGGKEYFFWDFYMGPHGVLIGCINYDYKGRRCELIWRRFSWSEKKEVERLLQ